MTFDYFRIKTWPYSLFCSFCFIISSHMNHQCLLAFTGLVPEPTGKMAQARNQEQACAAPIRPGANSVPGLHSPDSFPATPSFWPNFRHVVFSRAFDAGHSVLFPAASTSPPSMDATPAFPALDLCSDAPSSFPAKSVSSESSDESKPWSREIIIR